MTDIDTAIEQADDLRVTLNTPGWKIIEEFMKGKKDYHMQLLLKAVNINDVLKDQAFIEAIDTINTEIQALIIAGVEAERIKTKRAKK